MTFASTPASPQDYEPSKCKEKAKIMASICGFCATDAQAEQQ